MLKFWRLLLLPALLGLCVLACPKGVQAQAYSITDLGPVAAGDASAAVGIDTGGQACGRSGSHAALWNNGQASDLGTLPNGLDSDAAGINASGQVAGSSQLQYPTVHACLWTPGAATAQDCGTLGGLSSQARALNAAGQVAGVSDLASGVSHAFVWQAGAMTDLGTLPGDQSSAAFALNDASQAAGVSTSADGTDHAFFYQSGAMTSLGTLSGGTQSRGLALSADGTVVGEAQVPGGHWHAFLFRTGAMSDLGTLDGDTDSTAEAINSQGEVVGSSRVSLGSFTEQVPFVMQGGVMTDLNTLIAASAHWTLTDASGINDSSQIVGTGTNPQGQTHAYLLTPAAPHWTAVFTASGPDGQTRVLWDRSDGTMT